MIVSDLKINSKMNNKTVPISRKEVNTRVHDISTSLQEVLTKRLIEDTNQGILEAVTRSTKSYTIFVPAVVFGMPIYDPNDIAEALSTLYTNSGFHVQQTKNRVVLSWSD